MKNKKTRVLIIDDSAVMRKLLSDGLSSSRQIEVVGTALDPLIAVDKIKKLSPDVLTLDIEMPRMDGITFLSKLMISQPMPVIMVSAFTEKGAKVTMKALQLGAVDFVCKPDPGDSGTEHDFIDELKEKILAVSGSKIKRRIEPQKGSMPEGKFSADIIVPKKPLIIQKKTEKIIAIGASTGGTEVIAEILQNVDEETPGIVVVQHMPEKFTAAFADRINGSSRIYVKEAVNRDRLFQGTALIAPGNKHLLLKRDAEGYYVAINEGPPVNRHRPSVDVLFRSVAQEAGKNALGIILTGMGADGANGLLEMFEAEADTIAQDEASSIVFGMPKEAIKRGAARQVMNIETIIAYLQKI